MRARAFEVGVVAVVLAIASACGKDAGAGGVASIGTCRAVVRSLDAEERCLPVDPRVAGLRKALTSTGAIDEARRRKEERFCTLLLGERADDLERRGCRFALSEDERAQVTAARNRRTPIPASVSESERGALKVLALFRDNVCDCPDVACTRGEADRFSTGIDKNASAAAQEVAAMIFDEADVCHRAIERAQGRTARP